MRGYGMFYTDQVTTNDRLIAHEHGNVTIFTAGPYDDKRGVRYAVQQTTGKKFKVHTRGKDGFVFVGNCKVVGKI